MCVPGPNGRARWGAACDVCSTGGNSPHHGRVCKYSSSSDGSLLKGDVARRIPDGFPRLQRVHTGLQ
jgi:hypothetical protein